MQIREWAEQILFGSSLDEKLYKPEELSDTDSKHISLPLWPGRDSQICLETKASQKKTLADKGFQSDFGRASIFHFFANHELLALELMALALLKFPTAPKNMRRALTNTMKDEQKHLKQYIQRMRDLGLNFGELPLNSFFWRTISPCRSLEQFFASLSLTFEQANLDYSHFYMLEFKKLEDHLSYNIMSEVYEDEITHVHFGAQWLMNQKPQHKSLWEYHKENIEWPLTPARAKGSIFDIAARKQAGLDQDYIDKLQCFHTTKGKPPVLYVLNLAQKDNPISLKIEQDLSCLFLFVAGKNDAVVINHRPDDLFLKKLVQLGFQIPEIYEPQKERRRTVERVECYQSISNLEFERILNDLSIVSQKPNSIAVESDSKFFAKDLDDELNLHHFKDSKKILKNDDLAPLVAQKGTFRIKGNTASSGQEHLIFEGPADQDTRNRIQKLSTKYNGVIVENNHQRLADFSLLFDTRKKEFDLRITRQICDKSGTYMGTWNVDPIFFDLDREVELELMHSDKLNFNDSVRKTAHNICNQLRQRQYLGPGSIDGYIHQDRENKTIQMRQICEVNCRWTMGHFFHRIQQKFPKPGVFLFFNRRDLKLAGLLNFAELERFLDSKFKITVPCADAEKCQVLYPVYLQDPQLLDLTRDIEFLNSKCHSHLSHI